MNSIPAVLIVTLAALFAASQGKTIGDNDLQPAGPNRLKKRSALEPAWKTLILGNQSWKSYSQSWSTDADTPSGLTSYQYKAIYSQTAPPEITVITTNRKGEEKVLSYHHILTESWFKDRFGKEAAIPRDVKILDHGQSRPAPAALRGTVFSSAPAPWNTLLLGNSLSSKTFTQQWWTGGDTPSGLVSYNYTATYSQSNAPSITVIARTNAGEKKLFSYAQPLTESWFRERFGDNAAIPNDVRILKGERPQENTQQPGFPLDEHATWNNHGSRTVYYWWHSGGSESSRGYVGYNYTAMYSGNQPPKITIRARFRNGHQNTYTFDEIPSETWFKEMFGERVSVPKDAFRIPSEPSANLPPKQQPQPPQISPVTCPPLFDGEEPSFVGTLKTYQCDDESWRVSGSSAVSCLPNGQWSHKPTCIPQDIPEDHLPTATLPSYPSIDLPPPRQPPSQVPKVTCPPLSANDEPANVGASKTYRCDSESWRLKGSSIVTCLGSGQWTAKKPTCVPHDIPGKRSICPLPSLSEHTTIQYRYLVEGAIVSGTQLHFGCTDDFLYQLQGPDVLTCDETRSWRSQVPCCIPKKFDDEDCGHKGKVIQPMFDGVSVLNPDPWMMSLEIGKPNQKSLCGATLIHRQWVLTAAHCLFKKNRGVANLIKPKLYKFNVETEINRIYIHEKYEQGRLDFDVALIRLMHPINIYGCVPVCLPAPGQHVEPGEVGMAFGIGQVNATHTADTLQTASLTIISNNLCKSSLKPDSSSEMTENMFCTTGTQGLSSVCPGDSGGPMVFKINSERWTQFGIISWVNEAACNTTEEQYSGMVKVSAVLSWIRRYVP